MGSEASEQELRALLDKQAIHDVMVGYCRGVDRREEALVRAAYHEDSYDDHGGFKGSGPEFIRWLFDPDRPAPKISSHSISNMHIELDGDTAYVETYLTAHSIYDGEEGERLDRLGARYADRFERRDGAWKIAHRTVVHDWSYSEPYRGPLPVGPQFAVGERGSGDASYGRAAAPAR